MPRNNPPLVAVVDHDPAFLRLMEHILASEGYRTVSCSVTGQAHDWVLQQQPDLVILDTWLDSRNDGWAVMQTLWLDEGTRNIPILICSSDRDRFAELVAQLDSSRQVGIVPKPFLPSYLLEAVRVLLYDHRYPELAELYV